MFKHIIVIEVLIPPLHGNGKIDLPLGIYLQGIFYE